VKYCSSCWVAPSSSARPAATAAVVDIVAPHVSVTALLSTVTVTVSVLAVTLPPIVIRSTWATAWAAPIFRLVAIFLLLM